MFEDRDVEELLGMVTGAHRFRTVEFSDVLMCAKCIGECKIF